MPVVLLATAWVRLKGPQGHEVEVRALLDQGSEASFITEHVAAVLALNRERVRIPLSGIGVTSLGTARFTSRLAMESIRNPERQIEFSALLLPRLTSVVPSRDLTGGNWSSLADLPLADPQFYRSSKVSLILGAGVYGTVLKSGLRQLTQGGAIAQETTLGWIISGSPNLEHAAKAIRAHTSNASGLEDEVNLLECVKRFWVLEEIPTNSVGLKPRDQACEDHFASTYARAGDGRYIVRLPLLTPLPSRAQETRLIALNSFRCLERRFTRNPEMAMTYREFMATYESLGHMERVPEKELNEPRAWYLPHHPVAPEFSSTRKLRVVFDASRRTPSGDNLNQYLMSGPPLQKDLTLILTNWRRYPVAFTADIVKMFRQVLVDSRDCDFQRILWKPPDADTPLEYRLKTVTYGTACAPFLAMRTLDQLVKDEGSQFPLGSKCLQECVYVDDIFIGADKLVEATEIKDQLNALLRLGGFELGKWSATEPSLITNEDNKVKLIGSDSVVSTLGLLWRASEDCLSPRVPEIQQHTVRLTKRTILSQIAKLYDPLGWLSPVTVLAKIIMQDLWILKVGWDEPVPENIANKWRTYHLRSSALSNLLVSRWIGTKSGAKCELHGFSDASKRAYAAAVYSRVIDKHGVASSNLLLAKSKIAPIKTVSIPNSELCGATLLTRLINHVRRIEFFQGFPIYAWTDSTIVLDWLHQHPSIWKTFVANRTSFIQTELPQAIWQHVSSIENRADLATRGVDAIDLQGAHLWWDGSSWLRKKTELWPVTTSNDENSHVSAIPVAVSLAVRTATGTPDPIEEHYLTRFSDLKKLTRVTAWCLRFANNCRRKQLNLRKTSTFLEATELSRARITLIRSVQNATFFKEVSLLSKGRQLSPGNPLRKLNPILDKDCVLRVGGRLAHSALTFEAKHPPILPKTNHLSKLFVSHAHLRALHGGPSITLGMLRNEVWILGALGVVKHLIRECVTCRRARPKMYKQLMGDLPEPRISPPEWAFTNTGLDYAGPIQLRISKGRGNKSYKGYIALFVCLASKAVHLEAVSDLSTAGFLSAYRRFVGRRGICNRIYSDQGSNFKGADRELQHMFRAASEFYKEVASTVANEGTSWSFIPPSSPHFGGLWEAGVKSIKYHLTRIIGDHTLTFEELATVLIEIEACLNSRPLTPLTNDLDDL